ncbi:MAG: sulfurtransferase TusA family protein [Chlorobiaceae bacterium]|nr:sulfurtransferase TusA family protein [Chlorobiaceae bacterium]
MGKQYQGKIESVDLRGVSCPVNAIMAKRAIEVLGEDEHIRLLLDAGESLIRAVRSIKDAGYHIVKSEPLDNAVAIVAGKGKTACRP